ncbi:hypothetical protein RMCBS344292_05609 [Rhizopus microsporus]|nr:hypothetical protein RMCBS344292_05609 [Rhizopus microsporus]
MLKIRPCWKQTIQNLRHIRHYSSTLDQLVEEWQTRTKQLVITTHDIITGSRLNLLANTLPTAHVDYGNSEWPKHGTVLPPGWHHVYFPPRTQERDLAADGYEREFFPPKPFCQRMWAGASFQWNTKNPLKVGDEITMRTYLDRAEVRMGRLGQSAMVWINKDIDNQLGFSMREQRCLVYHSEQQVHVNRAGITTNKKPDFTMSIVPTSILLFRYSALTFNSHKIHFDHEYATSVEKHPACLVHGPLSGTLLLDLLRQQTTKELQSFEYKCLAPLYVNREMQLCGRKVSNRYELWIMNDTGYMAVKGSATLV